MPRRFDHIEAALQRPANGTRKAADSRRAMAYIHEHYLSRSRAKCGARQRDVPPSDRCQEELKGPIVYLNRFRCVRRGLLESGTRHAGEGRGWYSDSSYFCRVAHETASQRLHPSTPPISKGRSARRWGCCGCVTPSYPHCPGAASHASICTNGVSDVRDISPISAMVA